MTAGELSALQLRTIEALATIEPRGRQVGAAIAGSLGAERTTRDIVFFWYGSPALGDLVRKARAPLSAAGLGATTVQNSATFHRLRVDHEGGTAIVDRVAELCTLLSRQEICDLEDFRALVELGLDLERAIETAPQRDVGSSAMTLVWLLKGFPVERLAPGEGLPPMRVEDLTRFRDRSLDLLLERVRREAGSGAGPGSGS